MATLVLERQIDCRYAFFLSEKEFVCIDHEKIVIKDLSTGEETQNFVMPDLATRASANEEATLIYVCLNDMSIHVIDLKASKVINFGCIHSNTVTAVIECQKDTFLSASLDRTIRRWKVSDGRNDFVYTGHAERIMCMIYDKTRRWIISADSGGDIIITNEESGMRLGLIKIGTGIDDLKLVDHSTFAALDYWGHVHAIDKRSMKIKHSTEDSNIKNVRVFDVCPCTTEFLICDGRMFKLTDEKTVKSTIDSTAGDWRSLLKLHVSRCGRMVLTSTLGRVTLFRFTQPRPFLVRAEFLSNIASIKLLSDGRIVTSSADAFPLLGTDADWNEAVEAVKRENTLHPSKRALSAKSVIARYRFALFQMLAMKGKTRRGFPRMIFEIIFFFHEFLLK